MEAIDIAAHGGVKCHYEVKPLTELEKSVLLSQSCALQLKGEKCLQRPSGGKGERPRRPRHSGSRMRTRKCILPCGHVSYQYRFLSMDRLYFTTVGVGRFMRYDIMETLDKFISRCVRLKA